MNSKQIKAVMAIIRPALRALAGTQKFRLVKYWLSTSPDYGWYTIRGSRNGTLWKVKVEDDEVTAIE